MNERLGRQQFLGDRSDEILHSLRVGVVGLCGGGSHVVQQLAHVGIGHFVLIDHDHIDTTNLNRLVGGTAKDVQRKVLKTVIAARQIKRINPSAEVIQVRGDWRLNAQKLRDCDIVIGCVDTFAARKELESAARRYLAPYIDLGMDVFESANKFSISGQIALSMPGHPCLQCMGIITEARLAEEASHYGAAGGRPQVVWPNGVLASLAVGILVQLVTPWHDGHGASALIEYDGNKQEVTHSLGLSYIPDSCQHFAGLDNIGDPWFK